MNIITEKQMAKLGLCLDFRELDIDGVTTSNIGNGLDFRRLACSRVSVKEESQSIGNTLLLIP
jgi:hypothetical protein